MSKVDDELTRRLRRAERPVDDDGVFEGLARRRSHRERVRRVQAGMLAFAVLAATTGGFVALRSAFDGSGRDIGDAPILASNGEIVFAREGEDGRLHIYAARPDGSDVRQITEGETNDASPAVAADGRTVAFASGLDGTGGAVIATIPMEGGTVTPQTPDNLGATEPTWSPDGTQLAFVGSALESWLYVVDIRDGTTRTVFPDVGPEAADPSWSPDGERVVFATRNVFSAPKDVWGLATVRPDGSGLTSLVIGEVDAEAPAWSPDGTRIAFTQPGDEGDEVWTVAPDGTAETLIATAVEASLEPDLAWAPDGSSLLVSDGDWIYRVDATPEGDPRDNFEQLVEGHSPSWQPLPPGSEPSPTVEPEPSISPDPKAEGRDIGLGFNVCHLERLGEIDFLGDGTMGTAWTGAPLTDDGTCPDPSLGETYLVAADVDGDGLADSSSQTIEFCFYCRPFDVVDFDADADDELVVMAAEGSTPSFMVYDLRGTDGARRIEPVLVAEPGHREAGEEPGEPLTFATGGDEGYSGWVRCESFPAAPVLVVTWRDHPIEGDTMEVHETRFVLQPDGAFHVVGTNDYSAPVADAIPGVSDEPACGVDWQILG